MEIQYTENVSKLIVNQLLNWPFLSNNYHDLEKIKIKKLPYSDYFFNVQFNPARIKSSAAKVDKLSIENRVCFLCAKNRPKEQEAISFYDKFEILMNPYPIFPKHLTIASKDHIPQLIKHNFNWMLLLAKALPEFTIFYNGPRCGASAPDHFHFQAGTKNYMPIDTQIDSIKSNFGIKQTIGASSIWKINDLIRKFVLIESKNQSETEHIFMQLYDKLHSFKPLTDEPDLNIHCSYAPTGWRVLIFPREKHRPWQFYAEDDSKIIFSPASVDLGGLLILPREQDFEKIDKILAWSMMKQVGLSDESFNLLLP